MFVARAGISGRGRQGRQQSGIVALLGPKKKKKEKFRCWVPFMFRPCIAGLVGLLILMGGAAMCIVGFYAEEFSLVKKCNDTLTNPGCNETDGHFYMELQEAKRWHLHNMTYGGPVMMGIGCFILVISCVVVCEERDKMIKIMVEEEEKKKKKKGYKAPPKKQNIIERLVLRIKECTEAALPAEKLDSDVEKSVKGDEDKDKSSVFKMPCTGSKTEPSEKSYSHISGALLKIPTNIFTVDIEDRKTSLIPIGVVEHEPRPIAEQIKEHYNRIDSVPPPRSKSAPCLQGVPPFEKPFRQVIAEETETRCLSREEDLVEGDTEEGTAFQESDKETDIGDESDEYTGEEHRNLGFSSSSDECSSCSECECEGEYDVLQTTCDTKDTYVQLRLETDNDACPGESGESRGSNNGSRHKIIVHQASVHSAGDNEDKVEPEVTAPGGYKPKKVIEDHRFEELTCGVARANALAMDRFRKQQPECQTASVSSSDTSSDHVFMPEAMAKEFNLSDSPVLSSPVDQSKHNSSKKGIYAVDSASYGSQSSVCDSNTSRT